MTAGVPRGATDGASPGAGGVDRGALVAELDVLRARLRAAAGAEPAAAAGADLARAEAELLARPAGPTPLDLLADGFTLSAFERAVLLLTAGPELVAAVASELEAVGGQPRPSFSLALGLLPDAHWSAMTPAGPLRRWALVELLDPASPAHSPLRVAERVLHFLAGAGHMDVDVAAVARPIGVPAWLPAPFDAAADEVARRCQQDRAVLVHGPQQANVRSVAAAAAARAGLRPYRIRVADLPGGALDREALLRRLERETVLAGCAWAVDLTGTAPDSAGAAWDLVGLDAPVIVLADSADGADGRPAGSGRLPRVSVPRLGLAHRRELLDVAVRGAPAAPRKVTDAELDAAAGVFDLDVDAAADVTIEVAAGHPLWEACRRTGRAGFGGMARVLVPAATWADLVLPEPQLAQLRALVAALRHRRRVLADWGFGARRRGIGTAALFAGPSGTGKTLAAEVVAGAVGLDLVHVDLSQVVSKYIGETEKNLARLFDAAEDAGAVLLFDEADTLFGRRTEVRDSHDRYANLEVGYLLQRMEQFAGLAVLTTNDRAALDPAFARRLQYIVTFPYPEPAVRAALWRVALPAAAPTDGLDPAELAAVDLPGGGIAAAALTAAYLAADDGGPLGEGHVARAVEWELAKSGRAARAPRRGQR